jgi:hypothetical protein
MVAAEDSKGIRRTEVAADRTRKYWKRKTGAYERN